MTRPRVVLTGATGFLGRYLVQELRDQGLEFRTLGRRDADFVADLGDPALDLSAARSWTPDLWIHAAALSSTAACAADPQLATRVNAGVLDQIGAVAGRRVLISTDLVFDGEGAPYAAGDEPRPCNAYGRSKRAAELRLGAEDLCLRLPLLFGRGIGGVRGATDMLRVGQSADPPLTLFDNEFRTPLHVADAARGVVALARDPAVVGCRHLAGTERVSRWDFAVRFCAVAGLDLDGFRRGACENPERPRDVSLRADWTPGRGLDAALVDC